MTWDTSLLFLLATSCRGEADVVGLGAGHGYGYGRLMVPTNEYMQTLEMEVKVINRPFDSYSPFNFICCPLVASYTRLSLTM